MSFPVTTPDSRGNIYVEAVRFMQHHPPLKTGVFQAERHHSTPRTSQRIRWWARPRELVLLSRHTLALVNLYAGNDTTQSCDLLVRSASPDVWVTLLFEISKSSVYSFRLTARTVLVHFAQTFQHILFGQKIK